MSDDTKAKPEPDDAEAVSAGHDAREALATWANAQDEWLRHIVRHVLSSGRALTDDEAEGAYQLFRQEKALDHRVLDSEPAISIDGRQDDAELPLLITKVSDVTGVNAIVSGSVIEPHPGLTIVYGENGTGKTGYARIFKALAGSRTADVVLPDVGSVEADPQSARIDFMIGGEAELFVWSGEQGQAPFTRMSIFDSPSVNFHVDEDLDYAYVPTVLALFNHVSAGVQTVKERLDRSTADSTTGSSALLSRFPRDSTVYPLIETLGASTDLADLKSRADVATDVDLRIGRLRQAVAALEANTLDTQLAQWRRVERSLRQAQSAARSLGGLDIDTLNTTVARRAGLREDYSRFRDELFAVADLPADPEETWESFVASGEKYRQHIEALGVYDANRCLYCRQQVNDPARELISKYGEYLADESAKTSSTATSKSQCSPRTCGRCRWRTSMRASRSTSSATTVQASMPNSFLCARSSRHVPTPFVAKRRSTLGTFRRQHWRQSSARVWNLPSPRLRS